MPVHDYSDIQPIQFPFHMEEGKGSKKQFNFSAIENENSDIGVSHLSSKQVIENESPLEKMLTVLTGKTKSQRSSKDKAVKFPLKVSIPNIIINCIFAWVDWAFCTGSNLHCLLFSRLVLFCIANVCVDMR